MKRKKRKHDSNDYIVIGLLLVIYLLIIFFYVTTSYPRFREQAELNRDGKAILSQLLNENPLTGSVEYSGFVTNNIVDEAKLMAFAHKDYSEIKKGIGIVSDFCVYFQDSEGYLINISHLTRAGSLGIGTLSRSYSVLDQDGNIIGTMSCAG